MHLQASIPIRFGVLLAALFALFPVAVAADLLGRGQGADGSPIGRLLVVGALTALLTAAASAASTVRRTRLIAASLAAGAVGLRVANEVVEAKGLDLVGHAVMAALLCFTTWTILRTLFKPTSVDLETICASLSAYLLIGLIWCVGYSFLAVVDPTAFRLPGADETMRLGRGDLINPLYFSYVTLTTLGYGDIVPMNPIARTLAVLEGVVGQLLLVVLVARLVGLNVAQATDSSNRALNAPESESRP